MSPALGIAPRSPIEEYHLGELAIALDPKHPSHVLPPIAPEVKRVLDIGCGAGQTLIAACPDRDCVGVDVDPAALRLGRTLAQPIRFVAARAESLPFSNARFDLVIARVSLPYTNIPRALAEIHRVLAPGGRVWMTLHRLRFAWRHVKAADIRAGSYSATSS
jgi:ubiquinone/menaquinone biosynthesis C-methylase UbiE